GNQNTIAAAPDAALPKGSSRSPEQLSPPALKRLFRRQVDVDFKTRGAVLLSHAHGHILVRYRYVLLDGGKDILLQAWQVVRSITAGALVGKHEAQALLGCRGSGVTLAEETEEAHAVLPIKRAKNPRRTGLTKRCSIVSPRKRPTASS